jgi:hypothetical protein
LAYERSCLYNKFRDASLHFKKDMMQLFWIMKNLIRAPRRSLLLFQKTFIIQIIRLARG